MFVLPVIERELSVALRKYRADSSRFRVALVGAAVALFCFLSTIIGTAPIWSIDQMFRGLFYFCLYLAVIPPARICVGLISEERRNQTLELLYLTGMGSGELFAGKLLGGVMVASNDLLALAPFLAIPFLAGGVSLNLFLATIASLPCVLLFVVAVSVLASVACRDDGAALVLAVILAGVVCLALPLPFYLGKAVTGFPPFSSHWLYLSPAYGPYLVAMSFAGGNPGVFWLSACLTVGWSVLFLCLSGFILSRTWRQEIIRGKTTEGMGGLRGYLYGSPAWRAGLRARILSANPFQWLAQQDRFPLMLAWAWMGCIVFVWLLGWCAWPAVWPSPVNLYSTALILIFGVSVMMAYAGARRIGLDRRDGVLELLLTSPLSPEEIVDGQSAALNAQFRPVRLTLLALCILMMAGGYFTRTWNVLSLISYVLIWSFFIGWCLVNQKSKAVVPMWIALNTGRPAAAVFRLNKGGWWWFWMIFNLRNLLHGITFAGSFPTGSFPEIFIVTMACLVAVAVLVATSYSRPANGVRDLLISDMRLIARQPVPDRRDPRFKKWNGHDRLPTTMSDYVASLPDRAAARQDERGGVNVAAK